MTVERRVMVSLDEIKAITFECSREGCGARITLSPADLVLPDACPRDHRWDMYEQEGQRSLPARFAIALQSVIAEGTKNARGFRILLEIESPASTQDEK